MNPAATTATSGGLASALVVIFDWILGLCHVPAPPSSVDEALTLVITAAVGYYLHRRIQDPTLGLFMTKRKAVIPPQPQT